MTTTDEETKRERDEEDVHLREMLNILEHRRRLYELQKVRLGERTTPDIDIGLAETMRDIRLVEAKRKALRVDPKVLEAVGSEGLFLEISSKIDTALSALRTSNERQDAMAERLDAIELWQAQQQQQRVERQEELDRRLDNQDGALSAITGQLNIHDAALVTLDRRARWRAAVEVASFLVAAAVLFILLGGTMAATDTIILIVTITACVSLAIIWWFFARKG